MAVFLRICLWLLLPVAGYCQVDSNAMFKLKKGNLLHPLENCSEVSYHGKDTTLFTNIVCPPGGVTLYGDSAGPVKSICEGRVVAVINIGENKGLITRYGDFFVTYYPLQAIPCSKGDWIRAGDFLGVLCGNAWEEFGVEVYISQKIERLDDMEKWFIDYPAFGVKSP